uniref:Uncharacterized protein n=1 Tax=viral metagenome TaxID=1070528 RepID=A0A6C0F808_9ZZZZ
MYCLFVKKQIKMKQKTKTRKRKSPLPFFSCMYFVKIYINRIFFIQYSGICKRLIVFTLLI